VSAINIDTVVLDILGAEHRPRFREVVDAILRDLSAEETEALCGAYALGGRRGASTFLAARLTHRRRFVRIRPGSPRMTHVTHSHTFEAGTWYSVPEELGERLRDEPESDTGNYRALFQVESRPPLEADGQPPKDITFLL
jgi:hypothetical protein